MTVPQTEPKIVTDVRGLLNQNAGQIAKLLPRSIPSDRFLAIIMTTFQEDEKLQACSIASFAKCVLQCAQFGFLPGPRRQVYFVPFKNTKKNCMEVQLIPGYQGLLTLARNSGKITNVIAEAVYDGDEFTYTLGLNQTIIHVPKSQWREEPDARIAFEHMTYVYAIAKLKDGDPQFVVITKKRIDGHRDRFSKAKDDKGKPTGPWRDHPIEQSLKTALRELCNLLPSADEERGGGLSTAVTIDKQAEADVPQTLEPFTIEGLARPVDDGKKDAPQAAAQTAQKTESASDALTLGNFGPHANLRIDDPTVTVSGLEWYQTVITKNMKNKARVQFKDSDRRELIAIEKELERRKAARVAEPPTEKAASKTERAGEGQGKAGSGETAGKGAGTVTAAEPKEDDDLPLPADFIEWSIRAQETYRDLYYKVKDDLSLKAGDPVPVAKRAIFYNTYNDELTKAGKEKIL